MLRLTTITRSLLHPALLVLAGGCHAPRMTTEHGPMLSERGSFLGLSLPGDTQFTPLVVDAEPDRVLVARVSSDVGGPFGRSVQILRGDDDRWEFVGDRGRELLGADLIAQGYPFLIEARRDDQGRLWVVALINRLKDADVSEHAFFVYRLDGEQWVLAAPEFAVPRSLVWGVQLHFAVSGEPVLLYGLSGAECRVSVAMLNHEGRWEHSELEQTLAARMDADMPPVITQSAKGNKLWIAWMTKDPRVTKLMRVSLDNPSEVDGPIVFYRTGGWPQELSVSPDGRRALVVLMRTDSEVGTVGVIDWPQRTDREPSVAFTPMPLKARAYLTSVAWSPEGRPTLAATVEERELRVWRLEPDAAGWREFARVLVPRTRGHILDPQLTFRSETQPIVVWDEFFPVD